MTRFRHLFILAGTLLICSGAHVFAQTATLSGRITRENNQAAQWVNILLKGTKTGATTDTHGYYQLNLPAEKAIHLTISYIGYRQIDTLLRLKNGEKRTLNFHLTAISTNLPGFEVHDEQLRTESIIRLNPRDVVISPTSSSGVEG